MSKLDAISVTEALNEIVETEAEALLNTAYRQLQYAEGEIQGAARLKDAAAKDPTIAHVALYMIQKAAGFLSSSEYFLGKAEELLKK